MNNAEKYMKLIIDISEEDFNAISKLRFLVGGRADRKLQVNVINAVKNGTPLTECEADDCRSLRDIKEMLERKANALDGVPISDGGGACIGIYFSIANDLPPVYPKSDKSVLEDIKVQIPNLVRYESADGQDLIMAYDMMKLIDSHTRE